MPPRYAYWTIIVDDQPTAFRAGALEDIMPTFNRLKEKQPTAKLMWFQSGKLWPSRIDAREAMQMRGERGRDRDPRQAREARTSGDKPEWKPKSFSSPKPQAPSRDRERGERPEWKPKAPFKSSRDQARSNWKPKPYTERPAASGFPVRRSLGEGGSRTSKPEWKPKSEKLEWNPKGSSSPQAPRPSSPEKRKWVPKAEYKKSQGPPSRPEAASARSRHSSADSGRAEADIEAKRGDKWRPGGEHRDPKQKYKDAKKAKWTRFKQAIRSRATKKREP